MVTNTAKFILDAENRSSKGFSDFRRGMMSIQSDLDTLRKSAVAVLGFEYVVRPLARFGASLIERTSELAALRQSTGLTAETLSVLRYAAEQSDTSLEALAKGGQNVARVLYEASKGGKQAQDTLRAIGIQAQDNIGRIRPLEDILFELADRFKQLPDGAEKMALAVKFLGSSGAELIPLFNQGSEALREFFTQVERMGGKLNDETLDAINDADHSLKALKASAEGAGIAILKDLAPSITEISNDMRKAAEEAGTFLAVLKGIQGVSTHTLRLEFEDIGRSAFAFLPEDLDLLHQAEDQLKQNITEAENRSARFFEQYGIVSKENIANIDRLQEKLANIRMEIEKLTRSEPGKLLGLQDIHFDTDLLGKPKKFDAAEKAAYEAERKRIQNLKELVQGLREESETLEFSTTQFELYKAAKLGASAADLEEIRTLSDSNELRRQNLDLLEFLRDTSTELTREREAYLGSLRTEGKLLQESLLTPYERYEVTLMRLDELYQAHAIDFLDLQRAAQRATDELVGLDAELTSSADAGREAFRELRGTVEGWNRDFADLLLDSEDDFKSFIGSLLTEVARLSIAKLSEPFFDAVADTISGALGSAFGNLAPVQEGPTLAPVYPEYQHGTPYVPSTGLALVHQGERIIPAVQHTGAANSPSLGGITIIQNIDARNSDISEAKLRDAARRGAEEGYLKVTQDFTSGGPLRRMLR